MAAEPTMIDSRAAILERTTGVRWRASAGQDAFTITSRVVIRLTNEILERAAVLDPPQLRTLDAIHLATALSLIAEGAVEISGFVVYDRRLSDAARVSGLKVVSPGLA